MPQSPTSYSKALYLNEFANIWNKIPIKFTCDSQEIVFVTETYVSNIKDRLFLSAFSC